MIDDINEPRPVNKLLGEQPSMGPIPGDQVLPWAMIAGCCLAVKTLFALPWLYAALLLVWGISTWWILTGKRAWRFLSRFHSRPRWIRSKKFYESPFDMGINEKLNKINQKSKSRKK